MRKYKHWLTAESCESLAYACVKRSKLERMIHSRYPQKQQKESRKSGEKTNV